MSKTPRILVLFVLAAVSLRGQQTLEAPPQKWKKGFDAITEERCREWLGFLAGPECEGRGSGEPGYQKAAEYVAAHFEKAGLKPVGEKRSYFQGVPFRGFRTIARESVLRVGKTFKIKVGRDLSLEPADGHFEGEALFVVATNEAELPDSRILRNKVLVIDVPSFPTARILRQAIKDRPRAVLVVADEVEDRGWKKIRRPAKNRVFGVISRKAAERLAKKLRAPKDALAPLSKDTPSRATPIEKTVRITVAARSLDKTVPNVVGFLPGRDPRLKKEVVVIGSHLDHLGNRGGQIYPGADDDGSGSTGLLSVVKAFAENGQRPRRSLLFLAFCGEELGLLGSKYHVEHPIIPLERMVCELQMDMIGRDEEKPSEKAEENRNSLHLVGSKRLSSELHETLLDVNRRHIGFDFEYDEEGVYTRSDHYNFAKNGVPVAFFFSGFHPDYHKPTDTPDKIHYAKLARTARLVYLTAARIADQKKRLSKD